VRRSLLRAVFSAGDDEARFAFFETVATWPRSSWLRSRPARSSSGATSRITLGSAACWGARRRSTAEAAPSSGWGATSRTSCGRMRPRCARAEPGASVAVAIALGVDPLLSARGSSRLRLRLLDASVAGLPESPGASALTEALLARGLAWRELGELTLARADFERGLSLATRDGQPGLAAQALTRIGEIVDVAGSTGEARGCFARASTAARGPG